MLTIDTLSRVEAVMPSHVLEVIMGESMISSPQRKSLED